MKYTAIPGLVTILLSNILLLSNDSIAQPFVKSGLDKKSGANAEKHQSLTFDGAWCWFSDPRSVYYEGDHRRTYAGWIDSYGDVHVGYYDHGTKQIHSKVIYDQLAEDDHNTPSILFDEQGHLLVFFNEHSSAHPLYLAKSKNPEDISEWEEIRRLPLNDTTYYKDLNNTYTYTNPVRLSDENRIFIFWRGIDNKPNYSYSDDNGVTWKKGRIFILPERSYSMRRPYVKVYSNGKDKIHFAFTDGHPRKEPQNSIYYMCYHDGAFYHANGEKIKALGDEPVNPREADVVYDATKAKDKAWIWDVAEDMNGDPVLAYAKFPDDSDHIYSYAKWDGEEWNNFDLVNSGAWFPKTPEGETEREPNYSGGMNIDKEDPSVLYLSVNRDSIFEIEKWVTGNNGKKWKVFPVTRGSSKDNVRPFAVRNANEGQDIQVLWMTNTRYVHYTDYQSAIKMDLLSPETDDPFDPKSIINIMEQTADWQLANPRDHSKLDWHYGAFYTGLMALYRTTGENRYLNEMINLGQKHHWKLLNDIYHADRLTIAQVFADLYLETKDPEMLEKVQWVMDMHVDRSAKADVAFLGNPYRFEWWTWCDALYMAPPAFARVYAATGNEKYLDYLDEHWWLTSDHLYSEEDSLFYRDDRFFDKRTENGKKVFWGRGNGWVIAGIARVLQYMPEDYKHRDKFEQQFREMAYKLLSLQRDHGLWTASLLDPEQLPTGESSGSSFFTFALTWGINNGILERSKFEPAVRKAWEALVDNVNDEGRLGYVQQVAGSPYPFYEYESQVYATGAFLLAGSEIEKLVK